MISVLSTPIALPPPDAAALAHSQRLVDVIRTAIVVEGGWISFARYMELALYAPGLGYYAAGATKLGPDGDFITAPEMTPLFGQALAVQLAAILDATEGRCVLELGGGSGALAADLLRALANRDALPARYELLEPSPDLRARQQTTLAQRVPELLPLVRWLDVLPESIDGAVIANEVLDAVPTHVLVRADGNYYELGVELRVGSAEPSDEAPFAWARRPAERRLQALAAMRFPAGDPYQNEVNPAAEALVGELARRLVGGAILFIDYGFPSAEYYHSQRDGGTLMCHTRHRAHGDPFLWPGLTDITAHVDYSAMAAAGIAAGCRVAGYTAQAAFLLGCGILDMLAKGREPGSVDYLKAAVPVQRLLSPAEMGELFKVLALTKSELAWPGFALMDQRQRL